MVEKELMFKMSDMKFTLVSTVFNESQRIKQTISDIESQTVKPDEIVIVDAGSSDGTYEILTEWEKQSSMEIKIIQGLGCNVARGRNIAIEHSRNNIILSTDFGCRFSNEWAGSMIRHFADSSVQVVGGGFSVREGDILTLPARAAYILYNCYKVDATAKDFSPSSRSIAYYKKVFEKVGRYDEWLTLAGDDTVFAKKLVNARIAIKIEPSKYVYWGRHEVMQGYAKEAFRYGLGDGEARINFRSFISNLIELCLRYLLVVLLGIFVLAVVLDWNVAIFGLLVIMCLPGLRSYYRLFLNWKSIRSEKYSFKAFAMSCRLLEMTKLQYLKGYFKGYFRSSPYQKQKAIELNKLLNRK